MSDRPLVKLADLYEVHNGLSKGGKYFGSGYPFLSFSTVFNHYFIPDQLSDLVQATEAERESYSIKRGDIFVTRTSETSDELGMSCVALKDYPNATYNGFTKRMRPTTDRVLPEYIGYYMRTPSFRGKFQAFSTMTTRASLKNEDLLSLEVWLPSLEMQYHISSILSAYDSLIENNQRQIKLLEEAARRLYKEWFVDLHFPGWEHTKITDGVPEGWRKERADSFFSITIGKTPPRAERKWFSEKRNETNIPWLSIADMGVAGPYQFSTSEFLTSDAVKHHNVKVVPEGTVLLSFKLTVGRVAIATENMCTNEAIAHFLITNPVQREYLYWYLKAFEYSTLGSTSSISTAINSKIVKAMPVVIPNEKIVSSFHKEVMPMMDRIRKLEQQILFLAEARNRLLSKLMNGDLEVHSI